MLKPDNSLAAQIERGIAILRGGGVVAFPTDTVYGLGACADNETAVAKIFELKQRPQNIALPLLLADKSQISRAAPSVPPIAWLLINKFLPGALTLVLPKADAVLDIVTASGSTVAIRIPNHPVPVAFARELGPIAATSANLSGQPSALTAAEVYNQFGDKIDLVIDGGKCPKGEESTIVDVTGPTPVLLREGAISRQELEQVCEIK
ncbi:MAG: threonylcarbamoyl-AMP synthase [Dehalococcoidia bacterium]|nr:MAG: threonylcarbamoyl-AMP synthase [Dehalococcoidia bacterium]